MKSPLPAVDGFKFGCDPEMFVLDGDNNPVPATMIPGTKQEPHKVERGAVQRDGFAAEFNIDPVTTFKEWDESIVAVMKQLEGFLPAGHKFSIVPSIVFDKDVFEKAEDDVKELGCTPDFNAWSATMNPPPSLPENPYLRTASGHIHIGWGEGIDLSDVQHTLNCTDMVKQLDWYLGAWSVSIDKDPTRRQLYGKAGAYRPKPYGVEYRVLSNFWLKSADLRQQTWDRLQLSIKDMKDYFIPDIAGGYNDMLVGGIDQSRLASMVKERFPYPVLATEKGGQGSWRALKLKAASYDPFSPNIQAQQFTTATTTIATPAGWGQANG